MYGDILRVETHDLDEMAQRRAHLGCTNTHEKIEFSNEFKFTGRVIGWLDGETQCCHNTDALVVLYYETFDEMTGTEHGEPDRG